MKGKVFLVVRNAALINNGLLTDSTGTVHFSGHKDTSFSYLGGSGATTLYNLTVNKSAFGTALRSLVAVRNVLGVYGGTFYPDSNLILQSDKDLTARVDVIPVGANIIGKATVERYFPKRRAWRLVTSPLTATTSIYDSWQNKGVYETGVNLFVTGPAPTGAAGNGLDASPQNNSSMKTWNTATQVLEPVLNTKVLLSTGSSGNADNAGYFLFVRGDRDNNNFYIPNCNNTTLKSTGQLQVGTQHFVAAGNAGAYTLVGNPFASPVDFNAVSRTNLVKRFYIWDPSLNLLGAYVMLDDLDNDGTFTKSINASSQNNHLQSSQAFFVETQVNGVAGISFPEPSKSPGNNNAVFRPAPVNTGATAPQKLRIVLNLKEYDSTVIPADGVLAECNAGYSDSIDRDDALKFSNINETLSLLRNQYPLAAERRSRLTEKDTFFLKLLRTTPRKYEFQIEAADVNDPGLTAWLEDSYREVATPVDLYQPANIEFSVDANPASSVSNRFRIVFKRATVLPATILSLTGYRQDTDVVINWVVTNEINTGTYEVERSVDGVHFTSIAVKNATGSGLQNQYNITDQHPVNGYNFYRIKYIDETGAHRYSSTVKVKMDTPGTSSISIFPNPVENNTLHLQLTNCATGKYKLKLLGESGQLVHESNIENRGSNGSFSITPVKRLPAATYLLQVVDESNKTVTLKVTVLQ